MNERGQYGTPRVGQFFRTAPETYLMYPDHPLAPKVPEDFKISTQGEVTLLAALGLIVAIGVVGAKRGVKWM
jgi:hypothetical protein